MRRIVTRTVMYIQYRVTRAVRYIQYRGKSRLAVRGEEAGIQQHGLDRFLSAAKKAFLIEFGQDEVARCCPANAF